MSNITITPDEAKVVASLLELYDAAWEDGNHKRGCDCRFCNVIESTGEHCAKTFDSLAAKCGGKPEPFSRDDAVNGLLHMADDHPCCKPFIMATVDLIASLSPARNTKP